MKTIKVSKKILKAITLAVKAATQYEDATGRKLGITGEVAEVLASNELGLELLADPIYPGCDAIDSRGKCYQIKGARKANTQKNPRAGRIGTIASHKYDFLVLVLMDFDYKPRGMIYKLSYRKAEELAKRHKKRNPPIRSIALKKYLVK